MIHTISDESGVSDLLSAPPQLGETLQRLRRCARVSQVELGKILALHQSAISRIESNQQNLTPAELWKVAQYFGVTIDNLLRGAIDCWTVADRFGQKAPFPAPYRDLPFTKGREILPLLFFANSTKAPDFSGKLLNKLGIDNAYFAYPDQTLSTRLYIDVIRNLTETGVLGKKGFSRITEFAHQDRVHGFLERVYKVQTSSIGLIQARILNSKHYESNFHYHIERLDDDRYMEVSVTPQEHMRELGYGQDGTLGEFLCRYRCERWSSLPQYIGQKPVTIVEKQCERQGAKSCIYEITAA